MKKTLILVRHANAEDLGNSHMLKDFDRELTSKGLMQSARLGKRLKELNIEIDAFYASAAVRTAETAKLIAEQLKYDIDNILLENSLYGGGARTYLELVNSMMEGLNVVVIVGHNPDISFFTDYLSSKDVGGSFGKATAVILTFDDIKWSEISQKSGNFEKRIDEKELFDNEQ
jgi:phosphohistidine phosphatase